MSLNDLTKELARIRHEIQSVPIDHVSLEYCRNLLGRLHYIDPYFPPVESSIYGTSSVPKKFHIVWRRPNEFLTGKIEMFQGGIEESDINQGELGDCWLMCSLCALASRPHFIQRIYQNPEYCTQNFYRMTLCKDAEWQTVTVDDMIPCKKSSGKPLFSQANGNEIWVLILEKAYAKLYGSYLALKGGMAQESFEDLTGQPAFTYYFDKIQEKIENGEFWRDIMSWHSQGHCLLAATSSQAREDEGIVASHYYTIIKVADCRGHKLINLRNPWGTFEWQGPWSDNSREWTSEMIASLHPTFDPDDGAFWMSFQDFIENFQRLVVGKLGFVTDIRIKTLIKVHALHGAIPEDSFYLQVLEDANVVIELHQEDERSVGVETYRPYLDLGMLLIKENSGFVEYVPISQQNRECQLELFLQRGNYYVVPISGGNRFRREGDIERVPLVSETSEFHPVFQSVLKDIFRKYDKDLDQVMNCAQFLDFMSRIGIEYDEHRFYSVITNKYTSTDAGLTLQGFYELFYVALGQYGESVVRGWLTCLGYDEELYSIESRGIVASFHSTSKALRAATRPVDDNFWLYCWGEICKNKGELGNKHSSVMLYTVKHDEGVSIVLHNSSGSVKNMEIDCSESENVNYCIRSEKMLVEIPEKSWVIAEHLQCKKACTRYSYAISSRLV